MCTQDFSKGTWRPKETMRPKSYWVYFTYITLASSNSDTFRRRGVRRKIHYLKPPILSNPFTLRGRRARGSKALAQEHILLKQRPSESQGHSPPPQCDLASPCKTALVWHSQAPPVNYSCFPPLFSQQTGSSRRSYKASHGRGDTRSPGGGV